MILGLVGTNPYPFPRFIGMLDQIARDDRRRVVVQFGNSAPPSRCEGFDFAPHETILSLVQRARIVVAQAGYGAALDTLGLGRPLIVVPRRIALRECRDDQWELARVLSERGLATIAETVEDIEHGLAGAKLTARGPAIATKHMGASVATLIADHITQWKGGK